MIVPCNVPETVRPGATTGTINRAAASHTRMPQPPPGMIARTSGNRSPRTAAAAPQGHEPIRGDAGPALTHPVGPVDNDAIDARRGAESNVHAEVARREIAAIRLDIGRAHV